MEIQEIKEMVLKDLNDKNHKCYNDLVCIVHSYVRKKKIKPKIEEATSFIDEIYTPNKKQTSPNMALRLYCILNDIDSPDKYPKCPICGKSKLFADIKQGFRLSCGNSFCFQKIDSVNQKRQNTVKDKYGSLKAGYYDTMKNTVKEKYDTDNVSSLDWVKEKKIKTSLKNWGTDYPWQSEEGKKDKLEKVREKYGVDNVSQLDEVKKKKIETCLKNWGYKNPFEVPEIIDKIKLHYISKFNVENISQLYETHNKKLNSNKKIYKTESGKEIIYQGSENLLLDHLLKFYNEDDIIAQPDITIPYLDENDNLHYTFPDFLIKRNNQKDILIEGKEFNILNDYIAYSDLTKYKIIYSMIADFNSLLYIYHNKEIYRLNLLSLYNEEKWILKPLNKYSINSEILKEKLENLNFKNIRILKTGV